MPNLMFRFLLGAAVAMTSLSGAIVAAQSKEIRVAFQTLGKETLDPYHAAGRTDDALLTPFMENLVRVGVSGQIEPALAEAWTISDDGLVITFKLRPDVRMHDGTTMTAADVQFSFENAYHERYGPIVALRRNQLGDLEARAIDDLTVEIHLKQANSQLLNYLSIYAVPIVSKEHFDAVGPEDFAKNPAGTGPFRFVEGSKGASYKFERFDDYWGQTAKIDSLEFLIVPESSTRVAMLRSNDVDIILPVAAPFLGQLSGDDRVNLIIQEQVQLVEVVALDPWWPEDAPLKDPQVRRALTLAVDREAIAAAIFQGYGAPAPEFNAFDPLIQGQQIEDATPLPYDPEAARALLAEAGYGDGFSIRLFGPELWGDYARVVADYWRAVGVEASLDIVATSTFYTQFVQKVDSMRGAQVTFWAGFNGLIEDSPLSYCQPSSPYSFYRYEEHDRLHGAIGEASNAEERRALIHEAVESLREKACYIAPMYVDWGIATTPAVSGVEVVPGWGGLLTFPEALDIEP